MFNWIPFRTSRRIMANCNFYPILAAYFFVKFIFPNTGSGTVTPTTIGQNQDFRGARVFRFSDCFPPGFYWIYSKRWGVIVSSDNYKSFVCCCIIYSIRNSFANRIGREIIYIYVFRITIICFAIVFKITDKFLFRVLSASLCKPNPPPLCQGC